ncbi:tripartite tricarboxylate transporter substrate binding protein [Cupriavidus necator]|uniref:Bug family tripartite tricarboxylate transporter substrate binding protein n=1 Tax=Cupriavidus necator TaxID=106590 RepID=UPI003ECEE02E
MLRAMLKRRVVICALALSVGAILQVRAQDAHWPSKPIKFIVPFPAGGPTDALSRLISTQLSDALGQPIVVENVPGVGGGRGLQTIAASQADGYTIGWGQMSNLAINPHLYPTSSLKYDSLKDFTPVALMVEAPNVLIVNPKEPYKSLSDLIKAGRAKPGTIAYGSAGNGTAGHLATELLSSMTGAKFSHIPYKGNAAALTDLIGGNISFMFSLPSDAIPLVKDGRVRALATTDRKRLEIDSRIPTISETVPGYEVVSWGMVVAPAGLPRAITQRLSGEISKILRKPEVIERSAQQGWTIAYGTPEQAAQAIRRDLTRWGPIVKASGAKVE